MNHIDPTGLIDFFVFAEGDAAGIFGVEGAVGIVFDFPNVLESGAFVTTAGAAGANLGIGAGFGAVGRELEGVSYNIDINAGSVSPTIIIDEQGWNGGALSWGTGFGASFSVSETKTYSIDDLISRRGGRG